MHREVQETPLKPPSSIYIAIKTSNE